MLELVDPAFSHTQQVEYVIPRDEIPDDVSFVRVSVKVGTEEGKISQASNAVSKFLLIYIIVFFMVGKYL